MDELTSVLLATGFMLGLGLILAIILVLANKRFYVFEDPRIDNIDELLPAANCGACGSPGCRLFAEGLIDGTFKPSQCTVISKESIQFIADYLGVDAGDAKKRVARVACAGGNHVAKIRASYKGVNSCQGAALVSGGGKGCAWGCLGMGDCAKVCDFDAITMDEHDLPIVDIEICTACGNCVDICPKHLIELHPIDHQLFVACKNLEKGDEPKAECKVVCTACERCVVDSPEGLITIKNNLAVINYDENSLASPLTVERCPTGAIIWFDNKGSD